MILFQSDYTEGACPEILNRLVETNMEQTPGYSEDEHCIRAAKLIQEVCKAPESKVHFLVGGTQTNMTVIGAALRPYQGVLSAETGHIHVHETGAVESLGYKVLALPAIDGKIKAAQIDEACTLHKKDASFEHMVQPKMVYISQPTELGTLYTKQELEEIRNTCDQHELYLFVDGARLGYGLIKNHSMLDGNKRIGAHAMLVFLAINGVELQYTQKDLYSIILDVASGQKNEQDLWKWILEHQK